MINWLIDNTETSETILWIVMMAIMIIVRLWA
jgi:hypothetical protein